MTAKQGPTHDILKLGEDFELDVRAYQLRRAGRVLKLEPTPMELLLFLVQHRGELVTRDQIVEQIWGKDVFLDTDNSINGAIRKIRQVLKDDVERPNFVETVSGKGYRFIASIVELEKQEGPDQTLDFVPRGNLSARGHRNQSRKAPAGSCGSSCRAFGTGNSRVLLLPSQAEAHGKGHDCGCRLQQHNGRPRI